MRTLHYRLNETIIYIINIMLYWRLESSGNTSVYNVYRGNKDLIDFYSGTLVFTMFTEKFSLTSIQFDFFLQPEESPPDGH